MDAVHVLWGVHGPEEPHKHLQFLVYRDYEGQRIFLFLAAQGPGDEVQVAGHADAIQVGRQEVALRQALLALPFHALHAAQERLAAPGKRSALDSGSGFLLAGGVVGDLQVDGADEDAKSQADQEPALGAA